MSIKATFNGKNGGMLGEADKARQVLEIGKEYNVVDADIGSWITYITLEEHPNQTFNSVLFDMDFDDLMRKYYAGQYG